MSRVDTAWLRMDNDVNLMMIVGVWLLQPEIAYETLCERVADKLLKYERFRQMVVRDATGAATGSRDDDFDIHRHVVREKLKRARGQSEREALQARVGELATTPLDPDRPLWQFRLIESYDGGSALIARVHHCIGDGIALISVMMTITDGGSDPPARRRRAAAPSAADGADWLSDAVLKPLDGLSAKAADDVEASIGRVDRGPGRPAEGPRRHRSTTARTGGKVLGDVAAMAMMPDDSPTLLKGKPSGRKRVAWGEPIPLDAGQGDRQGARLLDQRRAARLRGRRHRRTGCASRATTRRARRSAPWCRSTCGRSTRPGSSATASAWRRWCCRSASTTRSAASTRCARA